MTVKRALLISPHFPPDSSAGAHRVRLLAPHLPAHGWEPVVLTLDPSAYETKLDWALADLVPRSLRVERVRAWPVGWTRRAGLGDLGLRSLFNLRRKAIQLLAREKFDLLFITIYPSYPALLGPGLSSRFSIPFVLDYQDPWVGSWGKSVGGGTGGQPDLKSRLTRWLACRLEPPTVRAAKAITAVSEGTYQEIVGRNPDLARKPMAAIPLGLELADFESLRQTKPVNRWFDPNDGLCHLCYTGTLLPLGYETLRALFSGAALLKQQDPGAFAKLRFHFFGTSNQSTVNLEPRVLPVAREFGLETITSEVPERIGYLEALTVQTQAGAILLLGSSEPHYTASKIYPALLARRPILALYHESSSVVGILREATRPPTVQVISYGSSAPPVLKVAQITAALKALLDNPDYDSSRVDQKILEGVSARELASHLAALFTQVAVS